MYIPQIKLNADDQKVYRTWDYVCEISFQSELVDLFQYQDDNKSKTKIGQSPIENGCCVVS